MKELRNILFSLSLFWSLNFNLYAEQDFSLRVVSYNMENFWDGDSDNTENYWKRYKKNLPQQEKDKLKSSPQYDAFSKELSNWYKPEILDSKINRLLEVIKLMKSPEIIALQELESAGNESTVFATRDLQGRTLKSRLESLGYRYFLVGAQDPKNPVSVTTAFISQLPLESLSPVIISSEKPSTSSRDLQVVALNLSNERVILVNNHWKSKRGGNNEGIRIQTAQTLRKRLVLEQKNSTPTHFIVLGDLNSAYFENPMKALGSTYQISRAQKNPQLLYNLWYEKPESERWETSFSGVKGTLSHILVSSSLLQQNSLHYKPKSFKVFGHSKEESQLLINVDGTPYRWQIRFYFDGFYHVGKGYSDHLPLMAEFTFNKSPSLQIKSHKKEELIPNTEKYLPGPSKLHFNDVKPCKEKEAINLLETEYKDLEDLNRKCVLLDIHPNNPPLPLYTRGRYHSSYIIIPSNNMPNNKLILGLSMVSPFNWRPNVYDSRVSFDEANLPKDSSYHDDNWHPHSSKCFQRKVLQRKGGAVRKVLGRVGYNNGYLSIHVLSRELSQIKLENLPESKKQACPWN